MKLVLSEDALLDLEAAVSYIADRNPAAARKLGDHVLDVIDQLAAGDYEGVEQELTTGERVRSWAVPPFRIYYQRRDGALLVLRIYHQAREPIAR